MSLDTSAILCHYAAMQRDSIECLPIAPYLDGICAALLSSPSRFLVLTAETAAGKSTAVPVALLKHFKGKILMLEPRRIAALSVTNRVAQLLGERTGETAGCIMRMERHTSDRTRFVVMTEGVLIRMIQDDPLLEGVDVVVLDEAHERGINTDLALALLKETMAAREDLRIIIMSATMDTSSLSCYLASPPAPVINIPGKRYPVQTVYSTSSVTKAIIAEMAHLNPAEVMLVFLPGIKEIRQVKDDLMRSAELAGERAADSVKNASIMVMHSSVSLDEQKSVLTPPSALSPPRIVLSSAIAETSLTVPCVRVVIDCGLSRINRMNVASGMSELVTETESTFSAQQRRGRAGRTGPGRCVRLWAEGDKRLEKVDPEILRGDIMSLVLECSAWGDGICNMNKLQWLTAPSIGAWLAARDTLSMMGLLQNVEGQHRITKKGKAALQLGIHPRLACVALAGLGALPKGNDSKETDDGQLRFAASCAIEYSGDSPPSVQQKEMAELIRRLKTIDKEQHLGDSGEAGIITHAANKAHCLIAGFPDRLARLDKDGVHYRFPSGRAAALFKRETSGVLPAWIVAPDVAAFEREDRVRKWEAVNDSEAETWIKTHSETSTEVQFVQGTYRLTAKAITRYGKIVLSRRDIPITNATYIAAVCKAVRENGMEWLPLGETAKEFMRRARFYAHYGNKMLPSDEDLRRTAEKWLSPFVTGTTLTEAAVLDALRYCMAGDEVDRHVPRRIVLENGTSCKITYDESGGNIRPVASVIIQRVFGCTKTVRIMGVPVTFCLLSPARRPLQYTPDLEGFWHGTWHDVAKEMRGRYPKHDWSYAPKK